MTSEVIEAHRRFATHAGKPGLPRWAAAVAVLTAASGDLEVPHVREIYAEAKRRREQRKAQPQASDERVKEILAAAGYNREVTPEVVERHRGYATHAGRPGLRRWKAAVAVLNGAMGGADVPPTSAIYAEETRRREVQRARAERIKVEAQALADEHADAARAHVARVWAETGEGPTWRELATELGVKGQLAAPLIDVLHQRGVLTSTEEPRSLAVGGC
ncbi:MULTISPECIES: hypothetical protein [unclassified Nocardioides]|uniref:hypothetical protein n=1 Tax=unclassified Nocardioides TaxID=2615069 RepID=UPI0009EF9F75|nr:MULTISPECIES: hypothetical protein [unclassified Nocardioides]GAW52536.1 uncharacterized protein PD653B2_4894 [Nocardioides sp. PD653-B2]GAW55580.1 uncharacterized protein PD653_3005 [Nocardioides sp. PD653]